MGTLLECAETITLNFVLNMGIDRLIALGIRTSHRDPKKTREIHARHVEQAEAIGRDPYRLKRFSNGGTAIPDSGRLMFGHRKAPGDAFTFAHLPQDLVDAGFRLVDFNLLEEKSDTSHPVKDKETGLTEWVDTRWRLFVNFKREGELPEGTQPELTASVFSTINGWWTDLEGFRNLDGRWNMNVKGRLQQAQVATTADKRIVRMDKDGVFRLIQVREPASKSAADTTTQAVSA